MNKPISSSKEQIEAHQKKIEIFEIGIKNEENLVNIIWRNGQELKLYGNEKTSQVSSERRKT